MMTASGELPTQTFPPIEFLPISRAQKYLADLEVELSPEDGAPLWFVHDGRTGTSHDFVSEAQSHYYENGTIDGALLLRIMDALADARCVFRIWWASDQSDCYRDLITFRNTQDLRTGVAKLIEEGLDIALRYEPAA